MFQDLREHTSGDLIDTDIAVIGAGAAGIAMAREFVNSRREVLLLESGALDPEPETLALNDGKIVGEPYLPLDTTRLRFFGGTTNHWEGHCRPLDSIDFEKRSWLPYSGWPITREDLEPFYERANEICELGPYNYDPEAWRPVLPDLMSFDPSKWVNRLWHFSPPTRFGEKYGNDLKDAANVTVLFNANVVEIVLNQSAKAVTLLKIKSLDGKVATVRPRVAVLACGGIENARLLLASNSVMTKGIGNANDLVGRFFMDHPHAMIAYALPLQGLRQYGVYYQEGVRARIAAGEAVIQAKPGLTEDFQRARQFRNAAIDMGWGYNRSEGYLALRRTVKAIQQREFPDRLGESLLRVIGDIDEVAQGVYRRLNGYEYFWFATSVEPEPNPASRVTLDRDRDALGSFKPRLDWRLTRGDKDAIRATIRLLGEELARLGVARMRIEDWVLDEGLYWEELGIRYHNIGTTRMSDDPKAGVVDRTGRVHGIANLYITGSSIFPTAGYANPTLSIVAFALRLADHLKAKGTHAAAVKQQL